MEERIWGKVNIKIRKLQIFNEKNVNMKLFCTEKDHTNAAVGTDMVLISQSFPMQGTIFYFTYLALFFTTIPLYDLLTL